MTDTDASNLHICRIAREVHAVPRVIAWVRDPALNQRFIAVGALIVNPAFSKLLILENMALGANGFAFSPADEPSQEIRVIKLQNSWLNGRELKQLGVPDDVGILRIERRGAVLDPEPGTIAQTNDNFTLSGPKEQVYTVARRFARRW